MSDRNKCVIDAINDRLRWYAVNRPERTLYVNYTEDGFRLLGYSARAVIRAVNDIVPGGWARRIIDPRIPIVEVQLAGMEPVQEIGVPFDRNHRGSQESLITSGTARAFALYGIGDEAYLQGIWVPDDDDVSQAVWVDLLDLSSDDPCKPDVRIYGRRNAPSRHVPVRDEPDDGDVLESVSITEDGDVEPSDIAMSPVDISNSLYRSFETQSREMIEDYNASVSASKRLLPDDDAYRGAQRDLQMILCTAWVNKHAQARGIMALPHFSREYSEKAIAVARRQVGFKDEEPIQLRELAKTNFAAIEVLWNDRMIELAGKVEDSNG